MSINPVNQFKNQTPPTFYKPKVEQIGIKGENVEINANNVYIINNNYNEPVTYNNKFEGNFSFPYYYNFYNFYFPFLFRPYFWCFPIPFVPYIPFVIPWGVML